MTEVDVLVVGHGIAGTNLSATLLKKGYTVRVFDKKKESSSSRVAGGIMNPITGKKMNRAWMVEEFIPFGAKHYEELQELLGITVLFQKPFFRYFSNPEDANWYEEKKDDLEMLEYVEPVPKEWADQQFIANERGGVLTKGVYQVNCPQLIEAHREWLKEKGFLSEDLFDSAAIQFTDTHTIYKEYKAKYIVFAEGPAVDQNPWFKSITLNVAKGEALIIEAPEMDRANIWKKGIFVMHVENGLFYVGSTNSWKLDDALPTQEKYDELTKKLDQFLKVPYTVVEHKAAIRPNSKDRRPIIGHHPEHHQLVVFNGFGTKGISLSPFFADQLVEELFHNKPLWQEVDVARQKF